MKFVGILLFLYAGIYLSVLDLNKPSRTGIEVRGMRGSGQNVTLFYKCSTHALGFFCLKYYLKIINLFFFKLCNEI